MNNFKFIIDETQEYVNFCYWYNLSGQQIVPITGDLNFVLLNNSEVFNAEILLYNQMTETYFVKLLNKDVRLTKAVNDFVSL